MGIVTTSIGFEMLLRWGHFLGGITWIGLLYYFNFVQTEYFKEAEASAKSDAIQKLVPRALWWFRWGAMFTLITGLGIFAIRGGGMSMDIYVGALFRTYLESIDINLIVKASNQDTNNNDKNDNEINNSEINNSEINNNDNIVLTLSNGCFWKKDLPQHPYNTEGIQELLDAKILFLTP